MKRAHKDWLYILSLFLVTVLTLISSINQSVKSITIIVIFMCVVIIKFFVKETDTN